MMLGPLLAVVFAGILGGGPGVGKQVKSVAKELHLRAAALPPTTVKALTHHGSTTKSLVQKMHVDGLVACEVNGETLRLVVYDASGALKTFLEVSVTKRGMAADDLDTLKTNLESDVGSLREAAGDAAPVVVAKADPPKATKKAAPPPKQEEEIEFDPEPARAPAPAPAPAPKQEAAKQDSDDQHAAAPTQTAQADDSVSAADIEALTGGGNDSGGGGGGGGGNEVEASSGSTFESLHLGGDLGFGITGRSFMPGPAAIAAYASSPVGAVKFTGHVEPLARLVLSVSGERTIEMQSPVHDGMASTTMTRWDAYASYALIRSKSFELSPRVGFGSRSFSIDSNDPSRAPDAEYSYVTAGLAAKAKLGSHLSLIGLAAFEPVFAGTEPTEMAFGEASRWAFEVGAALEYRHGDHLFARLAADYQRFMWSWDMVGARGAGGAVDTYPSGTLSVGAAY